MRSTTNGSPVSPDSLAAVLLVMLVLVAPPVRATDYEVRGNAMGFYYNTVLVHDGEGAPVTDATVTVNGTLLPHSTSQDGLYYDHLPAGVPDGSVLDLSVQVGADIVTARGTLPDETFLTAPADGASFQDVSVIPVSWTSATSPDRFILYAQWGPGRSYEIPGDARTIRPSHCVPSPRHADRTGPVRLQRRRVRRLVPRGFRDEHPRTLFHASRHHDQHADAGGSDFLGSDQGGLWRTMTCPPRPLRCRLSPVARRGEHHHDVNR